MVIRTRNCADRGTERAALTTDLVVAMAILVLAMLPVSFAFVREMKLCRNYYYQAVAMEIVDGEMEILAAGEWRAFPNGGRTYPVQAAAATNLPPGQFRLTKEDRTLRLEWVPEKKSKGIKVSREWQVPQAGDRGVTGHPSGPESK